MNPKKKIVLTQRKRLLKNAKVGRFSSGVRFDGSEVTEAQIAYIQRQVKLFGSTEEMTVVDSLEMLFGKKV